MEYTQLGHTDIQVSRLCLGSMTWGEQNTVAEAHQQLDYAVEHGINFVDTAELYPSPPRAETQGRTEEYIGSWIAKGNRDKIILASKVCGPARTLPWIRQGETRFTETTLREALDDSLQRLQTDYIDLYQLHWPDRITNIFGQLNYPYIDDEQGTTIDEVLTTLKSFIDAGKIRAIGLSNETPWGMMQFLHIAQQHDLPVAASIQNPYNLLNRSFETSHSEICHREGIRLLAYSPLAFGVLTGKYLNNQQPAGSRLALSKHFKRYSSEAATTTVTQYQQLASQHNQTLTQLALSFIYQQPFVTSIILGASNLKQLEENINSIENPLTPDQIKQINKIHLRMTQPLPLINYLSDQTASLLPLGSVK